MDTLEFDRATQEQAILQKQNRLGNRTNLMLLLCNCFFQAKKNGQERPQWIHWSLTEPHRSRLYYRNSWNRLGNRTNLMLLLCNCFFQAKKNGQERPQWDTLEFDQATQEQAILQKQLEQARKQNQLNVILV